MKRTLLACLVALGVAACDGGAGDDIQPTDAPETTDDGGTIDGPIQDGDGGPLDGGGACVLPSQTITCTVGNNAPCTAMCANAYCFNFNQVGSLCTSPCTPGGSGECPTGWTCNNMGRCRPPG